MPNFCSFETAGLSSKYFNDITPMETNEFESNPPEPTPRPFCQTFFHGTKADLKIGDFIKIGNNSNYGAKNKAKYSYLTATLDAAIWGAELALGEGRERIYLVEPMGPIEDDPNLTDKKFPGNPTMSYRSKHPFKVIGEITIWQGHPSAQINAMKAGVAKLGKKGIEAIED
jgi:rifampin ADP-ribosylating transferase